MKAVAAIFWKAVAAVDRRDYRPPSRCGSLYLTRVVVLIHGSVHEAEAVQLLGEEELPRCAQGGRVSPFESFGCFLETVRATYLEVLK